MARKRTARPQKVMMKGLVRRVRPAARVIARRKFKNAKEWFLDAVDSHPISEAIKGGDSSRFLSSSSGTLFGFMGFQKGSEPIMDLLNFLEENIRYQEAITPTKNSLYSVRVSFPQKSEMVGGSLVLPWEGSRPWPIAIEEGISGLPYYLNKRWSGSVSGEGFQIKNGQVRSSNFNGTPYLTPLIAQFRQKLLL